MTATVIAVISAVAVALVVAEIKGVLLALARATVRAAARRLPTPHDERWSDEWTGHVGAFKDRPLAALWEAAKLVRDAHEIRLELRPRVGLTLSQERVKRVLDASFAGLTLAYMSPFMAVLALLIRLESPGPVMHRSARRGRNGRTVTS